MKQLSWKPVRKGAIYCATACGRGCTHDEFLKAKADGAALAKTLGKGWKVIVNENLGWHFRVERGNIAIHKFAPKNYWANMAGVHQIQVHGRSPISALNKALDEAKKFQAAFAAQLDRAMR